MSAKFSLKAIEQTINTLESLKDPPPAASGTGGSGSSSTGRKKSGGSSSVDSGTPTDYDTGAFFGPNLPTAQEAARADKTEAAEERRKKELAAAETDEERSFLQQQHDAERAQEATESKQEGLAAKMKERRAAKLGSKKLELPITAQFAGVDLPDDLIQGREFRTVERGQLFQPARKSQLDLEEGIANIESKIQKLDSETGFKRVDARKRLLDERLELLSHPDVVKNIGFMEQGPRPIQLDQTRGQRFGSLPIEYTKYPKRDIGEERIAFLQQIPGAVQEVSDNYVTLNPIIIKREIDKTKAVAEPINEEFDNLSKRREQLSTALANYKQLLAPKPKREVTE